MNSIYRRTAAYVDLEAIAHNMREIRKIVKPGTDIMAIIKADAYGHGAIKVAHRLEQENLADAYGVAIVEEGVSLRIAGITKPILLLGYTDPELMGEVVDNDLTQTVFSVDMAHELSNICVEKGKSCSIHIKLDTGMSRIGFVPDDESLEQIIAISRMPGLKITGVFTHMARSDERDKTWAYGQFTRFMEFTERMEEAGISIPCRHISNSGAIIDLPEMNLDMVRSGIITYGLYPSEEVDKSRLDLIPALSWKTHISFVKTVDKGVPVSYGGTYVTKDETRVATVMVGYADGYPRALSNKGRVLVRGKYAPIIGRICMDQFMIDVTDIPGVAIGDTVTLIGRDGEACIPIEEPADMSGSFNYEFACNIGRRVERAYE